MKTIAAHALGGQRARQGEFLRDGRLRAMKRGIEAGDLRNVRGDATNCTDGADVMGLVQWRERRERLEIGEHPVGDQRWRGIGKPAMHNAVADAGEAGLAADMGREPVVDSCNGAVMIIRRRPLLGEFSPRGVDDA